MPQVLLNIFQQYGPASLVIIALGLALKYFVIRDFNQIKSDIKIIQDKQTILDERLDKESHAREIRFKEIEGDVDMLKTESLHSLQLINQNIAGIRDVLNHHMAHEEGYQETMDKFRAYVYKKLGPGVEDDK